MTILFACLQTQPEMPEVLLFGKAAEGLSIPNDRDMFSKIHFLAWQAKMEGTWGEALHSSISKTAAAIGMIIGLILQYDTSDK